jgi:hypothetical protein
MIKLRYMFVVSILFFCLAGSGCVGDNTSNVEESGIVPAIPGTGEDISAEQNLTEAEIQGFEENISEIEDLLSNSSLDDEIVVEKM